MFQNVQGMIEAEGDFGFAACCFDVADELFLRLADAAFGMGFEFEGVKATAMQQDEIGDAWLDAEAGEAGGFDVVSPAAVGGMEPNDIGCGACGEVLADRALYGGFVKRRHPVMIYAREVPNCFRLLLEASPPPACLPWRGREPTPAGRRRA
jgi:hypothetical protein